MTVSRVINGARGVRRDTRNAVLAAMREFNYVPNPAARILAGAQPKCIGLLYGSRYTPEFTELLLGALKESSRWGAELLVESCQPQVEDPRRAIRKLAARGVRGVILAPPLGESVIIQHELRAARITPVAIAAARLPDDMMGVRIDDFAAALEMTRHLLQLGHRRIGFIKGHPNQIASEERWQGFLAAMRGAGVNTGASQTLVEQGFFSYRSGLDAAKRFLRSSPRPTAIFASNDEMAAAVVSEAHRRGLEVPRDLTVVGFGDTLIATTIWPELTTMHQPLVEMAARAVSMLLHAARARASSASPTALRRLVKYRLVTRESAAPPSS